jgi:hypothetical protein
VSRRPKLPHGIKRTDWLVLDMDSGLLHVAPTRRAAVAWRCQDGHVVVGRCTYGPGSYEYGFNYAGEDDGGHGCFIARADVAEHRGWGWAIEKGLFDPEAYDEAAA